MMKRLTTLHWSILLIVLGCGVLSCDKMTKEADTETRQELNKYFVKCGEYYFASSINSYTQKRNFLQCEKVSMSTKETTSESDRLNGIEWTGSTSVEFSGGCRELFGNETSWSDWRVASDHDKLVNARGVFAEKKKGGQWEFGIFSPDHSVITCSDVPK